MIKQNALILILKVILLLFLIPLCVRIYEQLGTARIYYFPSSSIYESLPIGGIEINKVLLRIFCDLILFISTIIFLIRRSPINSLVLIALLVPFSLEMLAAFFLYYARYNWTNPYLLMLGIVSLISSVLVLLTTIRSQNAIPRRSLLFVLIFCIVSALRFYVTFY